MPRASRYSQPEPASYQDIPQTSPDLGYDGRLPPASARRAQYTQELRDRDSLDAAPRGYGYPEPAVQQAAMTPGYENPFASREQLPHPSEFSVEDDFNNVGPRYAEVYGIEAEEAEANKPVRPKTS